MILAQWSSFLMLGVMLQVVGVPPQPDDSLTAAEREQLQKEQKLDGRIKVYATASRRLFRTLEGQVLKEDFQTDLATLKSWASLLNLASKDIGENASRKKKSKALIKYEIELRKALADVQAFKIRAPVDQQDAFTAFLNHAEGIRKGFVDILFPG